MGSRGERRNKKKKEKSGKGKETGGERRVEGGREGEVKLATLMPFRLCCHKLLQDS